MVKAAVCREFGAPLVIEHIDIAEPGQGAVQVRLKACAICHSDVIFVDGGWGGDLPAVYGHEASGIVEALGPGVDGLSVGDPVVVTLIRSCGECGYCHEDMPTQCEGSSPIDQEQVLSSPGGEPVTQGLKTGAFADTVTVDASQVEKIDPRVPFDSASLLSCGVLTGLGAVVNSAEMKEGQTAVVIGCGGVGLNSIQGARLIGAKQIIAVDVTQDKLDIALQFGATDVVNARDGDPVAAARALTEGGRGVDFTFVTVGAKPAMEQATGYLKKGGATVWVGMTKLGVTIDVDALSLTDAGQKVIGSKMGSARLPVDIPWLVDRYLDGSLKLDELISGRFPIEDINEAMDQVRAGTALRNVIMFD